MVTKTQIHHSFVSAMFALEEALLNGWRLDKDNPPVFVGFHYEVVLVADEEKPPKLSRAEILAKARDARAAKRNQGE